MSPLNFRYLSAHTIGNWPTSSCNLGAESISHVTVYLENFIGRIQGVKEERTHITGYMFKTINILFCPKIFTDKGLLKQISTKKLKKCNTSWSATKAALGW